MEAGSTPMPAAPTTHAACAISGHSTSGCAGMNHG